MSNFDSKFIAERRAKRVPKSDQGKRLTSFTQITKKYDLTEKELISIMEKVQKGESK